MKSILYAAGFLVLWSVLFVTVFFVNAKKFVSFPTPTAEVVEYAPDNVLKPLPSVATRAQFFTSSYRQLFVDVTGKDTLRYVGLDSSGRYTVFEQSAADSGLALIGGLMIIRWHRPPYVIIHGGSGEITVGLLFFYSVGIMMFFILRSKVKIRLPLQQALW